jgi:hypothetical protein
MNDTKAQFRNRKGTKTCQRVAIFVYGNWSLAFAYCSSGVDRRGQASLEWGPHRQSDRELLLWFG